MGRLINLMQYGGYITQNNTATGNIRAQLGVNINDTQGESGLYVTSGGVLMLHARCSTSLSAPYDIWVRYT